MNSSTQALVLSDFGVCFGRRLVLASVDLSLPVAGIDVLMGPVKTGKSTLMRSLAGLNRTAAMFRSWGGAELMGRPIDGDWRPSLVRQHAAIFNGTIRDALHAHCRSYKRRSAKARDDFLREGLSSHGLDHLSSKLGEPMLALPIEWQRSVNILSHVLSDPQLLMIDEPTFGLEEFAAERLIEWLVQLGASVKLLVSLHHQGQARRLANRVILLGGGRVLAHEEKEIFFYRSHSPWVEQFVRTGSMAIASPDAKPEHLAEDIEPPPPLTKAALAALAEFAETNVEPAVAEISVDLVSALPPKSTQTKPTQTSTPTVPASHQPSLQSPPALSAELPFAATRARLPSTSQRGVQEAANVGRGVVSEYRGPQGFRWIVPNKLAGCPEPGVSAPLDYDMDLLRRVGISHLFTLTEKDLDQDALARNGLKNLHLPIFDREAPSIPQAYMAVYRMQAILDQGGVLAVHCRAGIGRTGTILAAWLIREGGLTTDGAIERLRTINPAYVQTEAQEIFLREFERDITLRM